MLEHGQFWLSSVERARRVADEKKKIGRRIAVKPKSANYMSGGLMSAVPDLVKSIYVCCVVGALYYVIIDYNTTVV